MERQREIRMTTDLKAQQEKRNQTGFEVRLGKMFDTAIVRAQSSTDKIRKAAKDTLSDPALRDNIVLIKAGDADAADRQGASLAFQAFNRAVGDTRPTSDMSAFDRVAHSFIVDAAKLSALHAVGSVAKTMVRYRLQNFKGLGDQEENIDTLLESGVNTRIDYFREHRQRIDILTDSKPSVDALNDALLKFRKSVLRKDLDGEFDIAVRAEIENQITARKLEKEDTQNFIAALKKSGP